MTLTINDRAVLLALMLALIWALRPAKVIRPPLRKAAPFAADTEARRAHMDAEAMHTFVNEFRQERGRNERT